MTSNKKPYGPQYKDAVRMWAISRGAKNSKINVLTAILTYCNSQTGEAFPGNKLIMEGAAVTSKQTLNDALRWLKGQGIIRAIAYETGGHGRAVTWAFGLPPWTTPQRVKTALENGEELCAENLPNNCAEPPQNLEDTSPVSREPTKGTELKGGAASGPERGGASRPANGDKSPDQQRQADMQQFSHWVTKYGYQRARELERERDAARLAAE